MGLVTIKSFPSGITLHLDPNAEFEKVLAEVETKFEESRKFFKNAKVALNIEDRIVSDEEEKLIIKAINDHTDLDLLCLVGKNPETERKFVKALKRVESQRDDNNARIYIGNIEAGEIVECEGSLIIIGDICKEAAAVATDDIIVIGTIAGQAYAGNAGKKESVIITMQLEPELLSIAGVKQRVKVKNGFGRKNKYSPIIIRLVDDKMKPDSISEELVKGIIESKNVKNL